MRELTQERQHGRDLIPRPQDGTVLGINPDGFVWLPVEGADGYELEIRTVDESGGSVVLQERVARHYLVPRQPFPEGRYEWIIRALDVQGRIMGERPPWSFSVPGDAPVAICPTAQQMLQGLDLRQSDGQDRHPLLVFPHWQLDDLRQRVQDHQPSQLQALARTVDVALAGDFPKLPTFHLRPTEQERRLYYFEYFRALRRQVDTHLVSMALYYLLTGDEAAGKKARELLLHVCGFNPLGPNAVTWAWGDEPGLSYSRCLHLCYDWTYDLYRDERERGYIEETLVQYARQTYRRLLDRRFLRSPGSSHDGRLPGYLGEQAMLLRHRLPEAREMLQLVLDIYQTVFPHWGGRDGGWAEGISYAAAYNRWYIPFFATCEHLTGFSFWQRPFFRQVKDFFIYCAPPTAEAVPFGDGQERGPGAPAVPAGDGEQDGGSKTRQSKGASLGNLLRFYGACLDDPLAARRAAQFPPSESYRFHIIENFVYAPKPGSAQRGGPEAPDSKVFRDIGWAALHSELLAPERNIHLIFKSSPYGSVSHQHADQNSFCIGAGGQMLAIASGYYGPAYGEPHHAQWTRQTKAHNSILVNGEGQTVRDHTARGRLLAYQDEQAWAYVAGDATEAYGGRLLRFHRHILFIRPSLFLIYDELAAPEPAAFSWLLHAYERPDLDDGASQVAIRRGSGRLDVRLTATAPLALEHTDRFDPSFNEGIPERFHQDRPNQHHISATTKPVSSVRILAVARVWLGDAEPAVRVETDVSQVRVALDAAQVTVDLSEDDGLFRGRAGSRRIVLATPH